MGYSSWGRKELETTEHIIILNFPDVSESKASAYSAKDPVSIPGLGKSTGEGNGNSLQYSCLESSMDREAWWATVHGVAVSDISEATKHV